MAKDKSSEGSAVHDEKVRRGQTLRVETTRDRSDDTSGYGDTLRDDLKGDTGDLSHSISNGKVPEDR